MSRTLVGDIGWCVVRMVVNDTGRAESLHIISPADSDENRYAPAESVAIYGSDRVVKLQAFLNDNLKCEEAQQAGGSHE